MVGICKGAAGPTGRREREAGRQDCRGAAARRAGARTGRAAEQEDGKGRREPPRRLNSGLRPANGEATTARRLAGSVSRSGKAT